MKTSLKITIVALIAVFFASCSSTSILKRKYTKGFYFEKRGKASETEKFANSASQYKNVELQLTGERAEALYKVDEVKSFEDKTRFVSSYSTKFNRRSKSSSSVNPSGATEQSVGEKDGSVVSSVKAKQNSTKSNSSKGGSANTIVLVILSLFPILCLIAVYLHDGSITKNFWIDLILHLTVIGEIIFALLVVLDVVNFA